MKNTLLAALSRRGFIKSGGLLAGGALLPGLTVRGQSASPQRRAGKAKYILFCVSDGMNHGTLSLAEEYSRRFHGRELCWPGELYRSAAPIQRSMVDTASANSKVTDSAAAGSAWGIGQRVNNRALNVTPDGRSPKPIAVRVKEAGMSAGLVTTARLTHATPASFAANVDHRNKEGVIARQFLKRKIDVLLGGGLQHFQADNLLQAYREAGYTVCEHKKDLPAPGDKSLLGLFDDSHLPYTLDHEQEAILREKVPTLAEMTQTAIDHLSRNPDGFLLQVEGGRVDHAGHANDPGAIVRDQVAFDDAVRAAWEFYQNHPDETLLIVTTDHGTGGCLLNGVGRDYLGVDEALGRLSNVRHSYEWLVRALRQQLSMDEVQQLFHRATNLELPKAEATALHQALQTEGKATTVRIAETTRDFMERATAVGWTSFSHTGERVEQVAVGVGSENFRPLMDNFETHGAVFAAMGLPA